MTCNILDSVSSMKQMHGQESSLKSDDRGIRNNGLIINIWTYEHWTYKQQENGIGITLKQNTMQQFKWIY